MKEDLFFELIRVAIGQATCLSHTPKLTEWLQLYEMAKKQSLVGICFAGVQKLQTQSQAPNSLGNKQGVMLYLQWMGIATKIQQRNDVVNSQCVKLHEMLLEKGYRSCILKGQGVALLYYHIPSNINLQKLRQSGDIDIWIEGGFEKVNKLVQELAPTNKIDTQHIQLRVYKDTEVEAHYKPFDAYGPKRRKVLDAFYEKCADNCFKNRTESGIVAPTTEFNLVHQLLHIHHHLFTEGVGLRQLMDFYFVFRTQISDKGFMINDEVIRVAHELGLDRFASALVWVVLYVFEGAEAINYNSTWAANSLWKPNEKDGRFLLNEILLSGNFGKQDERQRGLYDSKWNSFWMVHMKTFRLRRFDQWAWLWNPIYRIKCFAWRKMNGYK